MQFLAKQIDQEIDEYLKDIDTNWQPSDFLPESNHPDFVKEIKEIQEQCKELPYDYMAVLVGDIITEEAQICVASTTVPPPQNQLLCVYWDLEGDEDM